MLDISQTPNIIGERFGDIPNMSIKLSPWGLDRLAVVARAPAGGEDVDLVEGVLQREPLEAVVDVAVEHADAADARAVRHPDAADAIVGRHGDLAGAARAVRVGRRGLPVDGTRVGVARRAVLVVEADLGVLARKC